jgi:hypothetical protein
MHRRIRTHLHHMTSLGILLLMPLQHYRVGSGVVGHGCPLKSHWVAGAGGLFGVHAILCSSVSVAESTDCVQKSSNYIHMFISVHECAALCLCIYWEKKQLSFYFLERRTTFSGRRYWSRCANSAMRKSSRCPPSKSRKLSPLRRKSLSDCRLSVRVFSFTYEI